VRSGAQALPGHESHGVADPKDPNDKQEIAADAVALIKRHPYDDVYMCGGNEMRKAMEAESEKASHEEAP